MAVRACKRSRAFVSLRHTAVSPQTKNFSAQTQVTLHLFIAKAQQFIS
jgi:hypothetical protein